MIVPVADLGLFELIKNSGWIVKNIILFLFTMSILSWSIAFYKFFEFRHTESKNKKFMLIFRENRDLSTFSKDSNNILPSAAGNLFRAAFSEWQISTKDSPVQRKHLSERIQTQLSISLRHSIKKWEKYLSTLATIGSSSPFIGLLGTVWGIMNSFRAIALTNQSSLSIVAPGIAEALLATALGLFAAIPASIFYNYFVADLKNKSADLENFADEIDMRLSRYFDQNPN